MPYLISIVGFLGAWLLVAGPLMQGSIELREEELDRERFDEALSTIPKPDRISPRWWLLPPVAWIKTRRRNRAYHAAVMAALDQDLVEASVTFMNKATGWFIVAGGAALLGIKETWELVENLEWPVWAFWVLVVIAPLLCIVHLTVRTISSERAMGHERPESRRRPGTTPTSTPTTSTPTT